MYVLANRYDAGFNLADIPEDYQGAMSPLEFDKKEMKKLFDLGYQMAQQGYEWEQIPPALDDDEIFQQDVKPE